MSKNDYLTNEERQTVKVFNYIATYDGIIESEQDIHYLLEQGIKNFIPVKRRHLVKINRNIYPMRIVIKRNKDEGETK